MARTRLLVVDDDPGFVEALGASLTRAGYEVREARDGAEALAQAAQDLPDAILLDVRMPRNNGFEVCQALKHRPATQHIPVVFLTAIDHPAVHRLACEAGGSGCLLKPFRVEQLTAVIEAVQARNSR